MWSYFKPLRRKIGVVTLVVACVFMAGWVRSQFAYDTVYNVIDGNTFLISCPTGFGGGTLGVQLPASSPKFQWLTSTDSETLKCKGHLATPFAFRHVQEKSVVVIIRYYTIVIPLTALSSWLLLSRPRTRRPKQELQP